MIDIIKSWIGLINEWFNRNQKTILIGSGTFLIAIVVTVIIVTLRPFQSSGYSESIIACDTTVSIGNQRICFVEKNWAKFQSAKKRIVASLNSFLQCESQNPDGTLHSEISALYDQHFTPSTVLLQVEAGQSDTTNVIGLSSGSHLEQTNQLGRIHCLGNEYEIGLKNQSGIDFTSGEIKVLYFEIIKKELP